MLWAVWFDTCLRKTPARLTTNGFDARSGSDFEAVEGGVVELEAEDEGAIGGQVVRLGPPGAGGRLTTNGLGGGVPGDGGVEVVAVDGGGLVEGEALVGIPVFVLEFDAD